LINEEDEEHDIYIEPPEVRDLTDEDSGDDDDGTIENLSRGQLMAPAELCPRNKKIPEDLQDDSVNLIQNVDGEKNKKKNRKTTKTR
jgi:hypothetical protein